MWGLPARHSGPPSLLETQKRRARFPEHAADNDEVYSLIWGVWEVFFSLSRIFFSRAFAQPNERTYKAGRSGWKYGLRRAAGPDDGSARID